MPLTCQRCGQAGEPPAGSRVPFPAPVKERVLGAICANCWKEWEGQEVKVINEYRLSFLDPQHREMIQRACLDFLQLADPAPTA
jgi:Fe-S cluster biosynthesis and repair protein YggX